MAPQLPTMAPSSRRLPKPQCRPTLLNPLRFKFANESGPFEPYEIRRRRQFRASDKATCSRRRHPVSVTPNRGEKVAGCGASATTSQATLWAATRYTQCRQDSAEVRGVPGKERTASLQRAKKTNAAEQPAPSGRRVMGKPGSHRRAQLLPGWCRAHRLPAPHRSKGRRGFTSLWSRAFLARRGCGKP